MSAQPSDPTIAGSPAPDHHHADERPPNVLGPYRVGERLGAGGQATVYRADHVGLGRAAAIKVLSPKMAADSEYTDRFHAEATIAARLQHPHIVTTYDSGEQDGFHWLAMELVDGESVADRIARGPLSLEEAVAVTRSVALALDYAAAHGIIHRDVKPQNVLVDSAGTAKLADLGLAKDKDASQSLTATGVAIGTPRYASPEVAMGTRGRDLDVRSDVYSLGLSLWEMLTATAPLAGETIVETLIRHTQEDVPSLGGLVPDATAKLLDPVIARMTARERDRRYPSAAALADDLAAIAEGGVSVASSGGRAGASRSGRRRGARRSSGSRRAPRISSQRRAATAATPDGDRDRAARNDRAAPARLIAALVAVPALLGIGLLVTSRRDRGRATSDPDAATGVVTAETTPPMAEHLAAIERHRRLEQLDLALGALAAAAERHPEAKAELAALEAEVIDDLVERLDRGIGQRPSLEASVAALAQHATKASPAAASRLDALAAERLVASLVEVDRLSVELARLVREGDLVAAGELCGEAAAALDRAAAIGDAHARLEDAITLATRRESIAFWRRLVADIRVVAGDRPEDWGFVVVRDPEGRPSIRRAFGRASDDELAAGLELGESEADRATRLGFIRAIFGPTKAAAEAWLRRGAGELPWREPLARLPEPPDPAPDQRLTPPVLDPDPVPSPPDPEPGPATPEPAEPDVTPDLVEPVEPAAPPTPIPEDVRAELEAGAKKIRTIRKTMNVARFPEIEPVVLDWERLQHRFPKTMIHRHLGPDDQLEYWFATIYAGLVTGNEGLVTESIRVLAYDFDWVALKEPWAPPMEQIYGLVHAAVEADPRMLAVALADDAKAPPPELLHAVLGDEAVSLVTRLAELRLHRARGLAVAFERPETLRELRSEQRRKLTELIAELTPKKDRPQRLFERRIRGVAEQLLLELDEWRADAPVVELTLTDGQDVAALGTRPPGVWFHVRGGPARGIVLTPSAKHAPVEGGHFRIDVPGGLAWRRVDLDVLGPVQRGYLAFEVLGAKERVVAEGAIMEPGNAPLHLGPGQTGIADVFCALAASLLGTTPEAGPPGSISILLEPARTDEGRPARRIGLRVEGHRPETALEKDLLVPIGKADDAKPGTLRLFVAPNIRLRGVKLTRAPKR